MAWNRSILSLILSGAVLAGAGQAIASSIDSEVTDLLARSLLKVDCSVTLKVGLWHFDRTKIPVAETSARRIYDEITASLVDRAPRCMSVLDSVGVGAIMTYLHRSGSLAENGGNVIAALTGNHEGVDVVVFPDLYIQNGSLVLTMRSVETKTGRTVAQIAPVILEGDYLATAAADAAQPLDLALKEAATLFGQFLTKAGELQVEGMYFEESGAQPAAGRAIMDGLLAQLSDNRKASTGDIIKTRGIKLVVNDGAKTSAAEVNAEEMARKLGQPLLSGRYWVLDKALDVGLTLTLPEGAPVVWRGRIREADLGGLEVRPQNPTVMAAVMQETSLVFDVATERGQAPVYRPGERLQLILRSGQNASVYCYYVDSQQKVFPILPYASDQVQSGRNRVQAGVAVRFPDPARDPIDLQFDDNTLGEEMVACFASEEDISAMLDPSLVPGSVKPVPLLSLPQLRTMFQRIGADKIAESSVTVTLTRD